jgi:hypothetical protein
VQSREQVVITRAAPPLPALAPPPARKATRSAAATAVGGCLGSRSPRGGRRSPRWCRRSTTTSWPCFIEVGELAFAARPCSQRQGSSVRLLHATETSTPPWKPHAGGQRVGEARAGGMGGTSLAGSAGEPWIWWRRKRGGEEGERERVVGGGGCEVGAGDKKWKWARMVGMKERFKG